VTLRSRQRIRRLLRRSARVLRHHYGSLFTLAALAVALTVALTNSSFSRSADGEVAPPAAPIELRAGVATPVPAPADARVTYYLYEDEAQRALLMDILRRDYTAMTRMGLPDYIGEVNFLRVSTPAEEDYANFLVSEVVAWAKVGGLTVNVVDLR
jgi:hypothetical protein